MSTRCELHLISIRLGNTAPVETFMKSALGCGQVVKAPDFDSGIRRFESFHPSQFSSMNVRSTWQLTGFNQVAN